MKRRDLIAHFVRHDCYLIREGAKHSWWGQRTSQKRTAVPRHTEISDFLVRKICRDLQIPEPQ